MPVDRSNQAQVGSMEDALSFALASSEQAQDLLKKTKTVLSRLYGLVFPKLSQEKTLGELTEAFFVNQANPIEVLKCSSRIYRALLMFQLMMGHGVPADFDEVSKAIPCEEDGSPVELGQFTKKARECACHLIELVESNKKKADQTAKVASSASGQTSMP